MNKTQAGRGEMRSSKKNLRDRVLLASWIAVYSLLLWGFGMLKRFEVAEERSKAGAAAK
jgi:hypothetical protein